ncbi:alpha/beta-hydrolase [Decorospora gaudefroyi]|uniref:Alpha/beta-hydrolase n=1 Tax=Decorospora gaudefroyi TaxID=184978 RepID=A0A6A5KQP8_9PLEO|nr:alpha/beta-hydrolase [Decorospora gaudefroyi]
MAPLDDTTPATRFDSFDVYRTWYKKIGHHEIEVGILVPKNLKPGKHPLIVKFHGGALVLGDCLYPDWIAAFFVPFMQRNSAITILPNYRLIPEHSGKDILEDLQDFWTWLSNGSVTDYLRTQGRADLDLDHDHILVSGESAGGYMALMSALTQSRGTIKAVLAQYPMTNYLRQEPSDTHFGLPSPPKSLLYDHLASIVPGTTISSAVPPLRGELPYLLAAYDHYLTYFGKDEQMWPIGLIGEKSYLPPTLIIHGGADSIVEAEDSRMFVEKCKTLDGVEVKLEDRAGGEHGFDIESKEDEELWLKEGLAWVESKWLASDS